MEMQQRKKGKKGRKGRKGRKNKSVIVKKRLDSLHRASQFLFGSALYLGDACVAVAFVVEDEAAAGWGFLSRRRSWRRPAAKSRAVSTMVSARPE
jgi:hypothetical protein